MEIVGIFTHDYILHVSNSVVKIIILKSRMRSHWFTMRCVGSNRNKKNIHAEAKVVPPPSVLFPKIITFRAFAPNTLLIPPTAKIQCKAMVGWFLEWRIFEPTCMYARWCTITSPWTVSVLEILGVPGASRVNDDRETALCTFQICLQKSVFIPDKDAKGAFIIYD